MTLRYFVLRNRLLQSPRFDRDPMTLTRAWRAWWLAIGHKFARWC